MFTYVFVVCVVFCTPQREYAIFNPKFAFNYLLSSQFLNSTLAYSVIKIMLSWLWEPLHKSVLIKAMSVSNLFTLHCTRLFKHSPTCSCLSSQRSTMGWLALSDDRAVSLWNSLWLAHVPASRGRLRYVSIPLPYKWEKRVHNTA